MGCIDVQPPLYKQSLKVTLLAGIRAGGTTCIAFPKFVKTSVASIQIEMTLA
jgi:hypothetical protein